LLATSDSSSPKALANLFLFLEELNGTVNRLAPESNRAFPISSTQKNINDMIAYIREHINEPLTVTDLAKHFFLHPDYLSRLFKKHAHTTVSHYIMLQKIATAQSLLRDGHTVAEVQEKLGYTSYAYFFKTFQKNTGISPSKYRAQYFKQE
jgi:YesN/AraC family two-component response regulator